MTDYTPKQLQEMRDWVAVHVMRWRRVQNGEQPYYEYDELSLGVVWVDDYVPDLDANLRDAMMGEMHRASLTKHSDDTHEAHIWNTDNNGWADGSCRDKSPGLACLVAACRASGMEGV